jgi:tyrosine-protein kinase Etk/Wzc
VDRLTQTTLESPEERDLALSPDMQDSEMAQQASDVRLISRIRLLWERRTRLVKAMLVGFVVSALGAWLTPNIYEANVQLMPPDSSSLSGTSAMLGLLLGGTGGGSSGGGVTSGLAGTVSDLLGGQKPGPLFIGILSSRTVADRIIDRFDLRKIYYRKTYAATRKKLASRVTVVEDKKSGIINVTVEDPQHLARGNFWKKDSPRFIPNWTRRRRS